MNNIHEGGGLRKERSYESRSNYRNTVQSLYNRYHLRTRSEHQYRSTSTKKDDYNVVCTTTKKDDYRTERSE